MNEFTKGHKIKLASGGEVTVDQKLGEGGQGIVYKVKYNGKDMALKWYFGHKIKNFKKFYDNINNNIVKGSPAPSFLWPVAITEVVDGSFGYVMDLRPKDYKDFSMFLLAKERFSGIPAVVNAALGIIDGFRKLHQKGYSYQDLNDGNFFVNPVTGDVKICDNDNVAPYGEALGIAGKCRYMAPEIVVGNEKPSVATDRFSLAVILYLLLFLNHPLEGKYTMCPCLTEELEKKFYGAQPIFVWDPNDDQNRPVRGVHSNEIKLWPVYPRFIQELFVKAFSREQMVNNPSTRITEKEWEEAFTRLRDCTVKCSCGGDTFIDLGQQTSKCVNCGRDLATPMIMKVKRYKVAIWPGQKIYECHSDLNSSDVFKVTGEIITSKQDPSLVGLRNLSDKPWMAILPNGAQKSYGTNEVIRLAKGIVIDFGNAHRAEII